LSFSCRSLIIAGNCAVLFVCVCMCVCVCVYICLYSGWFGLRKEFCPWLLDTCPVLQEYGNISYKVHDAASTAPAARQAMTGTDSVAMPTAHAVDQSREPSSSVGVASHKRGAHSGSRSKRHGKTMASEDTPKFIMPVTCIDMPD